MEQASDSGGTSRPSSGDSAQSPEERPTEDTGTGEQANGRGTAGKVRISYSPFLSLCVCVCVCVCMRVKSSQLQSCMYMIFLTYHVLISHFLK